METLSKTSLGLIFTLFAAVFLREFNLTGDTMSAICAVILGGSAVALLWSVFRSL